MKNRFVIIVLDSVGVGELPDADKYGDRGSNTLGNIASAIEGFILPNMQGLGLGNIEGIKGFAHNDQAIGCHGKMAEKSVGKDTTTGHWEMMGIISNKAFPVYPNGFPKEIIERFEREANTKILGNVAASGTEIIKQLGHEHVMTGYPIVYTSGDSVFQIAAHEDIIFIEKLYDMCSIAREILVGEHAVGRVIARPFTGSEGNYIRTDLRHDFSINPIHKTVLDFVYEKGLKVKAVGKIEDIFCKQGITDSVHIHNNMDGVDKTIEFMKEDFDGLIFTNLVDFDMLYGHRNDVTGYAKALKDFDNRLPEIIDSLRQNDILLITADHGCDPTTSSTDHSREYVPLLLYKKGMKSNINLGIRQSFSDIAATIAESFDIKDTFSGISFLKDIVL